MTQHPLTILHILTWVGHNPRQHRSESGSTAPGRPESGTHSLRCTPCQRGSGWTEATRGALQRRTRGRETPSHAQLASSLLSCGDGEPARNRTAPAPGPQRIMALCVRGTLRNSCSVKRLRQNARTTGRPPSWAAQKLHAHSACGRYEGCSDRGCWRVGWRRPSCPHHHPCHN